MDKEARIISHFTHALNGDDGALLGDFVYSKDLFIENVHFKREWLSMQGIGAKAVLVNLSDAIAMNATPLYALLGLALPKELENDEINALCAGILDTCAKHGVSIIGGDTTSADKITISLTIISKANKKTLFRKNTKNGDFIAFTGSLGLSLKGLKALQNGGKIARNSRFIKPSLRIEFMKKSAKNLKSAMDISDGLANDLPKFLGKKGAKINAKTISKLGKNQWLSGEEYELLIAFSPKNKARVQGFAKQTRTKLTIIGQVKNGYLKIPKYRAFKHF
ncbi:thiamine-phosphate kinase [Campylobacter sp.]|uniref:thiamine-phosphate kinase n=1 Tax=Campylobacter sp. TaxID=205 RepID=UPI002AA6FDCB|nr:thiamine-phosphate kinase [Campylobacter sp.]MCI7237218.1 thiamine-phosphate kinase [Campylobacter sp.]